MRLADLGNHAGADDRIEISEPSVDRKGLIVECGRILRKRGRTVTSPLIPLFVERSRLGKKFGQSTPC